MRFQIKARIEKSKKIVLVFSDDAQNYGAECDPELGVVTDNWPHALTLCVMLNRVNRGHMLFYPVEIKEDTNNVQQ